MIPKFVSDPDPSIYIRGSPLVLDFETTNLDKGSPHNPDNQLLLACWTFEGKRCSQWGNEYQMGRLLDAIKEAPFIVAHNAKFELGWLRRCGVELRDILCYDTFLGEWVLLGNRTDEKNLEACCARRGLDGKDAGVAALIELGVCPSKIPEGLLESYCHKDVEITGRLFEMQVRELEQAGMLGIVYQRNLMCACLADIEFEGLVLDVEAVRQEYAERADELVTLRAKMQEMCGEINLNSRPQLAKFLYDDLGFEEVMHKGKPVRTDKGGRKTDEQTLLKLKAKTKEQREFVKLYARYAKVNALLSKNLTYFYKTAQADRRVFGEFVQGRTATHRLASNGRAVVLDGKKYSTQLQNLPREYKRLFGAPDGWLVGEADGASLEFRAAAILAKDPVACEDIRNNLDVHTQTAKFLTDEGQETDRQEAKSRTFTPLFAGRGKTKAEMKYSEFFRKKYFGITKMQNEWANEVLRTGTCRTPYGLMTYWPNAKMSSDGWLSCQTQLFNLPIQGFATGEIIPCGVIWFWHRTRGLRIKLCNTVHDSIIAYVHPDEQQKFTEIAVQSLTRGVYYYLGRLYNFTEFPAPLGVGVKIGTHWGKGDETKVDVPYEQV